LILDVIFRKAAKEDLLAIQAWYEEQAPGSVERILADIYRSIERIREHPQSAETVHGRSYRRVVTRKYHFKVVYLVKPNQIDILGIYRYQNREI
jgi:plasmid stabilization system protein ParE